MRTNSVMSYLLMSLKEAGYTVNRIEIFQGNKTIDNPAEPERSEIFGTRFENTRMDEMMLRGELEYNALDGGVVAQTDKGEVWIAFDPERFRPAEVPILLSDTKKIGTLGFKAEHSVRDIIRTS